MTESESEADAEFKLSNGDLVVVNFFFDKKKLHCYLGQIVKIINGFLVKFAKKDDKPLKSPENEDIGEIGQSQKHYSILYVVIGCRRT